MFDIKTGAADKAEIPAAEIIGIQIGCALDSAVAVDILHIGADR